LSTNPFNTSSYPTAETPYLSANSFNTITYRSTDRFYTITDTCTALITANTNLFTALTTTNANLITTFLTTSRNSFQTRPYAFFKEKIDCNTGTEQDTKYNFAYVK